MRALLLGGARRGVLGVQRVNVALYAPVGRFKFYGIALGSVRWNETCVGRVYGCEIGGKGKKKDFTKLVRCIIWRCS